ncbi:MAG TPA: chemotaxis protein CheD [Phormidium sp.]
MIKAAGNEYVIQMGELQASVKPAIITCFGLGSCIGLFLYDRVHKIGGGAHIMLPTYNPAYTINSRLYFASDAVDELIYEMVNMGAGNTGLRAKLVGGASVAGIHYMNIGKKNSDITQLLLIERNIYIAASDLGGNLGKTARFDISTGMVAITTETSKYTI